MALTAPTAPTPPTPPVVPRVVLGGGGSVTESTQPVSGTSNNETQARAAVARGDGALSKTTTEAPEGAQGAVQSGAQQSAQAQKQGAQAGAQEAAIGAGTQGTQAEAGADAMPSAQQQALEEGRQAPTAGGHGALYIGFSIVSFLVLAAAVFFWLRRRAAQGGLRLEEMARDLRGAASPSEDVPELRGLTAGEVLEDIEAEEQRQLAAARARAQMWRSQRERERSAAQKQAAGADGQSSLRSAAREEQQRAGARAVPDASRQPEDGEERHFEVRV